MYLSRILETSIAESLKYNPVTAVLGPRQCGKSTLVKELLKDKANTLEFIKVSFVQGMDEYFLPDQRTPGTS